MDVFEVRLHQALNIAETVWIRIKPRGPGRAKVCVTAPDTLAVVLEEKFQQRVRSGPPIAPFSRTPPQKRRTHRVVERKRGQALCFGSDLRIRVLDIQYPRIVSLVLEGGDGLRVVVENNVPTH